MPYPDGPDSEVVRILHGYGVYLTDTGVECDEPLSSSAYQSLAADLADHQERDRILKAIRKYSMRLVAALRGDDLHLWLRKVLFRADAWPLLSRCDDTDTPASWLAQIADHIGDAEFTLSVQDELVGLLARYPFFIATEEGNKRAESLLMAVGYLGCSNAAQTLARRLPAIAEAARIHPPLLNRAIRVLGGVGDEAIADHLATWLDFPGYASASYAAIVAASHQDAHTCFMRAARSAMKAESEQPLASVCSTVVQRLGKRPLEQFAALVGQALEAEEIHIVYHLMRAGQNSSVLEVSYEPSPGGQHAREHELDCVIYADRSGVEGTQILRIPRAAKWGKLRALHTATPLWSETIESIFAKATNTPVGITG